jgi:hypothetical protein
MKTIQYNFIDIIPEILEEGILYISIKYKTASHKCICGCGNEVVTPITPTDWNITFDGKRVSLSPSIGNWNFDCKSHYWIVKNEIIYSTPWNAKEIEKGRTRDKKRKKNYWFKKKA